MEANLIHAADSIGSHWHIEGCTLSYGMLSCLSLHSRLELT